MTEPAAVDCEYADSLLLRDKLPAIMGASSWVTTIDDPGSAGATNTHPARRLEQNPSATSIKSGGVLRQRGFGIDRGAPGDGPAAKEPVKRVAITRKSATGPVPQGRRHIWTCHRHESRQVAETNPDLPNNRCVSLDLCVCALIACESATTSSEDRSRSAWGRGGLA